MTGAQLVSLTFRDVGELQATGTCLEVVEQQARLALAGHEGRNRVVAAARLEALLDAADALERAALRLLDELAPELGTAARDAVSLSRAEAEIANILTPELALGRERHAAPAEAPSESELTSLSYFLARSQVGDVIASDRRAFVQIGRALSDEGRIEILGYLLQHDHATPTQIAEGLHVSRAAVGQHLRLLADNHMVALKPTPTLRGHWTVTPPTKKALAGLHDLLMRVRQGPPAADTARDGLP